MQDPNRPLVEEFFVCLFSQILVVGEFLYKGFERLWKSIGASNRVFPFISVAIGVIFLAGIGSLVHKQGFAEALKHYYRFAVFDRFRGFVPRTVGFCLASLLPLSLLSALIVVPIKKWNDFEKGSHRIRRFNRRKLKEGRSISSRTTHYLGLSMESGKPIFLTDEARRMHCHVVGSTGSGKTESVLMPMIISDILKGKGAIIIDAKGDFDVLAKLLTLVRAIDREKDFSFFSLAHPEKSDTYNPIRKGGASEIKDKIIGANIWTEEHYKKKSEDALLTVTKAFLEAGTPLTFREFYRHFINRELLQKLAGNCRNQDIKEDLLQFCGHYDQMRKSIEGLIADIGLLVKSEFSELINVENPEINLLDVYEQRKIAYFQLNTQAYEDTARRFGRLILQDIKGVSNYIEAHYPPERRHFSPVFIDEFGSFTYPSFIEFLNKARGAGFAITLAHQSLGDLAREGTHYQQQILENTNIKIIMRQDDPRNVELFSRMAGTRGSVKMTYQTKEQMMISGYTGMGSLREVEEFIISPNRIKQLQQGEAALIMKVPTFIGFVQLDYIGPLKVSVSIPTKSRRSPNEFFPTVETAENLTAEQVKIGDYFRKTPSAFRELKEEEIVSALS